MCNLNLSLSKLLFIFGLKSVFILALDFFFT